MARSTLPKTPEPLDAKALDRLALSYAGRYATTQAKLRLYLRRKLVTRGWSGAEPPPVEALVERMAALGYVDDRAFADARAAALGRRGYGARRIGQALRAAGIEENDALPVRVRAEEDGLAAALVFARRRRLGPFSATPFDRDSERRALAAMMRAGHAFAIARRVLRSSEAELADPETPRDGE